MGRDYAYNPDPSENGARIVGQATAQDAETPADVQAACEAWASHVQSVDERGMTLLKAAFDAAWEAKR